MNVKKLFVSVFLLTFLVGIIGYFLFPKKEMKEEISFEKATDEKATEVIKNTAPNEERTESDSDEISENDLEWVEDYDAKFKIKMLTPGEFHGDEVKAKSGETWIGLFKHGKDYSLQKAKINVKSVFEILDNEKKGKKTGKGISVAGKDQPIFLLKNAEFLKPQKIITAFYEESEGLEGIFMSNEFSHKFDFENTTYNLFVTTEKEKGSWLDKTSKLVLSDGKTEQIIYSQKLCDDCGWRLIWSGDLDGDGKLDLFLDLTNHYNVSQYRLFLSSKAEKGNLVKEVANFRNVGC